MRTSAKNLMEPLGGEPGRFMVSGALFAGYRWDTGNHWFDFGVENFQQGRSRS